MSVCWECFVLSGRGFCDGLMTRLEDAYRVWCVCLNVIVRPWPTRGCWAMGEGDGMKREPCTFLKHLKKERRLSLVLKIRSSREIITLKVGVIF